MAASNQTLALRPKSSPPSLGSQAGPGAPERRSNPEPKQNMISNVPLTVEQILEEARHEPDRVWIVAVLPAKRRPGYWRERLG